MYFRTLILASCLAASACAHRIDPPLGTPSPPSDVDAIARSTLAKPNIGGIGMARIIDGEIAWTGYWGEQSPGVPVGPQTAFNTASVAKTIIAETVLRLVQNGELRLDDPIAEYYRHPDLASDPRYDKLTPKLLLSHQAGLKNWAYAYDDGKLAFIDEPGNGEVHYSGAGITILMRYLEERFDEKYPELVDRVLFGPLGVTGIEIGRTAELEGHVAGPIDAAGKHYPPFTYTGDGDILSVGSYNPADNLYATVPGYAGLLVALIEGRGLSEDMQQKREELLSASTSELGYVCHAAPTDCPDPLGYGLGWGLFGEPDRMIVNHGGNDFGEHAQVYFSRQDRDGLVLFVNGGGAFESGIDIIEVVEPDLLMAKHFRALIDMMKRE